MTMRFSLMEAVHYADLLTESQRKDFVLKTHGSQLDAKYASKSSPDDVRSAIEVDQDPQPGAIASRVIDYISGHDPSLKKIYTLWMTQRYLKGQIELEDLPGLEHALSFFDANKLRFKKRDIGQYRTVAELYDGVKAFREVSAPAQTLRNDSDMRVVYDSKNLSIVEVKSAAGAIELAGDAVWCTAWKGDRNRFHHYDGQGHTYVIIDKKRKARWQIFLPAPESRVPAEFMDRSNTAVSIGALVQEYPPLFAALGENAFLPYASAIGLDKFTPAALRHIEVSELAANAQAISDIMALPADLANSSEFASQIIVRLAKSGPDAPLLGEILKYYLPMFDDDFFSSLIPVSPWLLSYLPARMKTDANKIAAADGLHFSAYKLAIGEPWPTAVNDKYWLQRVRLDPTLNITAVDEKYLTDDDRARLLTAFPSDIADYKNLTEDIISKMAVRDYHVLKHVPSEMLTIKVAGSVGWSARCYSHKEKQAVVQLISKIFPLSTWPHEWADALITSYRAVSSSFAELPKSYADDPAIIMKWLNAKPSNYTTLPARYRSADTLSKCLSGYSSVDLISSLTPKVASPHEFYLAVKSLVADGKSGDMARQFQVLPEYLKTEEIIRLYIEEKAVPVEDMKDYISTDAVVNRTCLYPAEVSQIPPNLISSSLAVRLATENPETCDYLPDRVLTEEVLRQWLVGLANPAVYSGGTRSVNTRSNTFARFGKSAWSQRTLPLMVQWGFVPAELSVLPKEMQSGNLISAIAGRNETVMDHEDAHIMDEDNICRAIEKNWKVYAKLRPDQLTEGIMYTFLKTTARSYHLDQRQAGGFYPKSTGEEMSAIYSAMPKAKWSKRCWAEAVGYVAGINKVPATLRTDEMIASALRRDALQARLLTNPSEWLDAHAKILLSGEIKNKIWNERLQSAGVIKIGREYVDVIDMPHAELSGGFSYVLLKAGQVNFRAFIMNKKKQIVARLYSEGGEIKTLNSREMMDNAGAVKEFALAKKEYVAGFELGVLGYVGVQYYGDEVVDENELPARSLGGRLAWARGDYGDGSVYLIYKGDKLIVKITSPLSGGGGFGNRPKEHIDKPTIFVKQSTILTFGKELADGMNHFNLNGWNATNLGCGNGSRHNKTWNTFAGTKIASTDAFSVWRGADRYEKTISIYSEKYGLVGQGVIRKNGSIAEITYPRTEVKKEVMAAFDQIEGKVPYHV